MCEPISATIASAAGTGLSMYQQAENQSAQQSMLDYQSQVAANNQAIAQQQAQNALSNGEIAARTQMMKNDAAIGADRARMAASGLDLSMGSPTDVLSSDQTLGDLDTANILRNASQQAYGLDAKAMNDQAQSQLDSYRGGLVGWNQNMALGQFGLSQGTHALDQAATSYL